MRRNLLVCAVAILAAAVTPIQAVVTRSSTDTPIGPWGGTATCSNTTDGSGGITSSIVYPETGTITDVDVRVEITHTWRSDLQFHVSYSGGGGNVVLVGKRSRSGRG
jgi:hypothetical protein